MLIMDNFTQKGYDQGVQQNRQPIVWFCFVCEEKDFFSY